LNQFIVYKILAKNKENGTGEKIISNAFICIQNILIDNEIS